MENRLFANDKSLNMNLNDENNLEWQDMLIDEKETQDKMYEKKDEYKYRKKLFTKALTVLNTREKEILKLRRMIEKPKKLEELSKKYNISRERVRQIEEKAIQKIQKQISQSS